MLRDAVLRYPNVTLDTVIMLTNGRGVNTVL